jgi:hypothetical protein
MSLDEWCLRFLLALLNSEDGGTTFLQNTGTHTLIDTASHPSRPEISTGLLWEPQISHVTLYESALLRTVNKNCRVSCRMCVSCVSSWPCHTYFVLGLGTTVYDVSPCSLVDKCWCYRGVSYLRLHFVLVRIYHAAGTLPWPLWLWRLICYGYLISLIMCEGSLIT